MLRRLIKNGEVNGSSISELWSSTGSSGPFRTSVCTSRLAITILAHLTSMKKQKLTLANLLKSGKLRSPSLHHFYITCAGLLAAGPYT